MELSVKERLIEYLRYIGVGQNKFEKMVGLSNGYISNLKRNPSPEKIKLILDSNPRLRRDWLIYGEGEMLSANDGEIEVEKHSVADNKQEELSSENVSIVPLLPIEAMAGSLSVFSQGVSLRDCRKIKAPVDGADFAIQISGDSMEPELHNGSYLYIRKMTGAFIPWGNAVVIDTYDGVVVKKIFPGDNGDEEYVWAKSVNPNYPPFKIAVSEIIGVYRILGWSYIVSTM